MKHFFLSRQKKTFPAECPKLIQILSLRELNPGSPDKKKGLAHWPGQGGFFQIPCKLCQFQATAKKSDYSVGPSGKSEKYFP